MTHTKQTDITAGIIDAAMLGAIGTTEEYLGLTRPTPPTEKTCKSGENYCACARGETCHRKR